MYQLIKNQTKMKTNILKLAVILLIFAGSLSSCEKNKGNKMVCNVKNPLTDLPWLKDKVAELTSLYQGQSSHIAIWQCTYGGGYVGFWEGHENVAFLFDCNGDLLCTMNEATGVTSCPGVDIDLKKLIWEINNN